MQLSTFNHSTTEDVQSLLQQMAHIPRWATEILQQRPYTSKDDLLHCAKHCALSWTWQEISAALGTHPRIGEKQAKAALSAKEVQFSEHEQAAVSQDTVTQAALLAGNLAYEEKFNFIFLIRAAGRSSQDILAALHSRLGNTLEDEKKIVHEQLSEIALLRLAQEISE